jgi:hypothetical protein
MEIAMNVFDADVILTTDKPDIEACLFMISPTSRNLTPGLTIAIAFSKHS